ncbi:MAG: sulfotransferase [Schleiferiaceae bacterium]
MPLPNVIIAGAPKCGTSSLYFWLAAHPQACASKQKETFFFADEVSRFNTQSNFKEHGLEAYSKHFSHCQNAEVTFEATAPYIYFNTALEQIPQLESQPKVVFILRDPAKRIRSQYLFEKFRTQRISGSLEEYVKEPGIMEHGKYIQYLQKWKDALGEDRMEVVILEEMLEDLPKSMGALAKKLGLDGSFYSDFDFSVRNETVKIKRKWLHQWGLKIQPMIPHWVQKTLLPMYLSMNSGGKPQASEADKEYYTKHLANYYEDTNKELFAFLGREIKHW